MSGASRKWNEVSNWVGTVSSGVDKSAQQTGNEAVASTGDTSNAPSRVSSAPAGIGKPTGAPGETVATILQRAGRLAPLDALRYLTPLISVLGALHGSKQAHGNLALELLRVTKGEDGALRLQILKGRKTPVPAADASPKAALAGRMVAYSSPEQIQGATASEHDDMYAVGHLAYTLLVGEPYWADEMDRLAVMALCKTILGGAPEAPSVRAMRRKNVRLPQDFDAWFVLITDRKHSDRFADITDAGIALTSVLSNPDLRELSRSVQFKFNFNPNVLDMPAQPFTPPPAPPPEPENLRLTAVFTIVASVCVAIALISFLRWTHHQESVGTNPTAQRTAPSANGSSNIDAPTPNRP